MTPAHAAIEQRDASSLAQGYSRGIRTMEILSIVAFVLLESALAYRVATSDFTTAWIIAAALVVGYVLADFISGVVHWAGDTWGSTELPIVGRAFIRPFREHHVDEKAITRHDFVETNGNNCLVSLPVALAALLIPHSNAWLLLGSALLGAMILWVMATNQFHKWSHQEAPPRLVIWAQQAHLILPPDHHHVHHTAPFNAYYCITVGWMNKPLAMVGFFPRMERLITGVTGMLPRRDDIGEKAAEALIETALNDEHTTVPQVALL